MIVSGRVFGLDSLPAAGVTVFAYHTDAKGWYWKPPDERTVHRVGGVLDSAGVYRCPYDLCLGEMYPTDAKADSFRRAQDLELEKLPRQ